jgi:hypothetical protein
MSYLSGIQHCKQLSGLSPYLGASLAANQSQIKRLLDEPGLEGLGDTDSVMPFSEVVERYNKGISADEIKAWVWYKRSIGSPMKGWESYYLKSGEATQYVEVTSDTLLLDPRMTEVRMAYPGENLGKLVKEHESKSGTLYLVVRSSAGLFMVKKQDCKLTKGEATNNQAELNRLVAAGVLFS